MSRTLTPSPRRTAARSIPKPSIVPATSPGLQALRDLAQSHTIAAIEQLVEQGHAAIWGGNSWEAPLTRACDVIPIGINELWRHDSLRAEAVAENHHQIPSEFCSMIKALAGRLHLRKESKIKRILYFGSTCEPISMVFEFAQQDGYELFCIDAASTFKADEKRDELVKYLVRELERAAIWLTGKPTDLDRVREEIRLRNTVSAKIRRLLDLRLHDPLYLPAAATGQLLAASSHYYGNPTRFIAILDQLIAELEVVALRPSSKTSHIPLVLAGGFASGPGLLQIIEESRGAIVGWATHGTSDYREDISPLESIAHYLFEAQIKGELGEVAGASAIYRKVGIEQLVKQTQARGIISASVTGCPYGSVVQGLERDYFKKQGIPMVALEHNIHAEEPPTEEQITKIKTFIEMLS